MADQNTAQIPGLDEAVQNLTTPQETAPAPIFNPLAYQATEDEKAINNVAQKLNVHPTAVAYELKRARESQGLGADGSAPQAEPQINPNSQYSPEYFVAPTSPTTVPNLANQATNIPGAAGALGQTFSTEQRAIKAAADAGALKATEQAAYQEQLNNELVQRQQKVEKMGAELEEKSNTEIAKLQEIQKQTQDFKFQDFWADKSTGQKILAGISIFLGGLGAGMQGAPGTNKALDIINQAIDRDMQKQKAEFEKLKDTGEQSKSILAAMNQKFDNSVMAENASRVYLLQVAQNKLNQIASKYEGPELQAKAQQLNAQLERQKIVYQEHFKREAQTQALLTGLNAGTGDYKNLTPAQVNQIDKVNKGFAERYVPGYGEAVNGEQAKEFMKYKNEIEPAISGAKRILDLSKNFNRITDQKQRAQIQTEIAALVGQLRLPFTGPGAMTDKEFERLADTIGNPTKFAALPAWERVKLQTVLKKLETDLFGRARSAGFQVGNPESAKQKFDFKRLGQ